MANKKIGYFISGNARMGFVGGVGGPYETCQKELYGRMTGLLKPVKGGTSLPSLKGLSSDEELQNAWETRKINKEQVPPLWDEHKKWWTIQEIMSKFAEMEKEDEEALRSDTEGHGGASDTEERVAKLGKVGNVAIYGTEEEKITRKRREDNDSLLNSETDSVDDNDDNEDIESELSLSGVTSQAQSQSQSQGWYEQTGGLAEEDDPVHTELSEMLTNFNVTGEKTMDLETLPKKSNEKEQAIEAARKDDTVSLRYSTTFKGSEEYDSYMQDITTKHCYACGKDLKAHTTKKKGFWIGCDKCERWFVNHCIDSKVKEKDNVSQYWQCPICTINTRKVESLLDAWPKLQSDLHEMQRCLSSMKRDLVSEKR